MDEGDVGGSFMANKYIYCNKLSNPDRLDALEGIEHGENEYSEYLEGTIVEFKDR